VNELYQFGLCARMIRFTTLAFAVLSICLLSACNNDKKEEEQVNAAPKITGTINVLIVGDPKIGAVIQRHWQARTESELKFTNVNVENFRNNESEHLAGHDVAIYPSGQLANMATNDWISPLSDGTMNSKEFGRQSIFNMERNAAVSWGRKIWAVSLGTPRYVLMFDKTRLEQLGISPPTNRSELVSMVDLLRNSQEDPTAIFLEPTSGHWASYSLLTRAADYVVSPGRYSTVFDIDTGDSLIARPAFVRALTEMKASWDTRGDDATHLDPSAVVQQLAVGKAIAGFSWPHAIGLDAKFDDDVFANLHIVAVPTSRQWFEPFHQRWEDRPEYSSQRVPLVGHAGFLASVTSQTKKKSLANRFLIWLGSKEISELVSPYSSEGGLTRPSQSAVTQLWLGNQWTAEARDNYGQIVASENEQVVWLSAFRIPRRERYLEVLDQAIRDTLEGKQSPEQALTDVAQKWNQITDEFGRDKMKSALRKELGLAE
jgi:ABC-type glycerol-3-phosphate transport system substrate-binding protein